MADSEQLVLPFAPRACLGDEDFLVADCNRDAISWLDRWPDWPAPGLIVHGPEACGKSHLVQLFLNHSGGTRINTLTPEADIYEVGSEYSATAVDDADVMIRQGRERPLLHLYNGVKENGGQLLLTGSTAPGRWPFRLSDLASRLRALPAVGIDLPDDSVLVALVIKLFHDRQVAVDNDVPAYIIARISRSFAAARAAVDVIDRRSLAQRRRVSVALVRDTFAANPPPTPSP